MRGARAGGHVTGGKHRHQIVLGDGTAPCDEGGDCIWSSQRGAPTRWCHWGYRRWRKSSTGARDEEHLRVHQSAGDTERPGVDGVGRCFEFISSSCSIRFECGGTYLEFERLVSPHLLDRWGGPSFRLFGRLSGVTPPRFASASLTVLAALLLWLLLLPAFAFAFSFALLTSSADFLFFFRGEELWVVEFIPGVKLVALVPRVAPPSGVVDVFPGPPQHGCCKHCRGC